MKLIVLDRDGVVNADSDAFIKSVAEWRPIPGSLEAIARLSRAGYRVVVFTNQSGLARGLFDAATLDAIHAHMRAAVADAGGALAGIYFCPHGPEDGCACRKPKPGMLRSIEADFGVALRGRPIVGDALRDLQAAQAVGGRAILVLTGKGAATAAKPLPEGVTVLPDLAAVADLLLGEE